MHVLLTEDNALIASGIVAGLQAQGFTVAHAATAAQADALLRRAAGRTTHLVEHGSLTYDPAACSTFLAGQPIELSRREQALLQALLHNPGRVLSAEQLKDAVYGLGEDVESNALNVHIHYLRRKLGNGIVETVRGLGYRLGTAGHGSAPTREADS